MQYLLDTHTLLWFLEGDAQLPEKVKAEIKNLNNKCYVSIASLWEVTIKMGIGKLNLKFPFADLASLLFDNDIELLPISFTHLLQLAKLYIHHKDPFDRIIIAQATTENLPVFTKDEYFKDYPVTVLW